MSRFLVVEKIRGNIPFPSSKSSEYMDMAPLFEQDLAYKLKLEKQGKLIGGPFLDNLAESYILTVKNVEEMGEIFFNSPVNLWTEREVHPLGTYADSMEGMKEMASNLGKKSRKR